MAAASRRAGPAMRTSHTGRSATVIGRHLDRGFFADLAHELLDFPVGPQRHIVAMINGVKTLFRRGTEPFELCLVFPLTLLQKPQAFSYHLAGVAEVAGRDAGIDEAVKVLC